MSLKEDFAGVNRQSRFESHSYPMTFIALLTPNISENNILLCLRCRCKRPHPAKSLLLRVQRLATKMCRNGRNIFREQIARGLSLGSLLLRIEQYVSMEI